MSYVIQKKIAILLIKHCRDCVRTTQIKKRYVHKVIKGTAEITNQQNDTIPKIKVE
jgi:hypothetical protein